MPANRFRIASVTKPITAMAILHLIDTGQLTLDTKVYDLLKSQYPLQPNLGPLAPGVDQITVRQLLNHTAGWGKEAIHYDPMFDVRQISLQVGVPPPADRKAIIQYMWSIPPINTGQYSYANFHYCLLGRVIEAITGEQYASYISQMLHSHPIHLGYPPAAQGSSLLQGRLLGETRYFDYPGAPLKTSVFPPYPTWVPDPYGGFYLENMDSHGGWVLSTIDLLKFMKGVFEGNFLTPSTMNDVTTNRVPTGQGFDYGLGWGLTQTGSGFNWFHTGSLPGTTSIIFRTKWSDGSDVCWAALLNSRSANHDTEIDQDLDIWGAMQTLPSLPNPIFLGLPWQSQFLDPDTYQQILYF